jgi:hypothetical protein
MTSTRTGLRGFLVGVGLLYGCEDPSSNPRCDGPCPASGAEARAYCNKLTGYYTQCGMLESCEAADVREDCLLQAWYYRIDVLTASNRCSMQPGCGLSMWYALGECVNRALQRAPLSTAYRELARATCHACPYLATSVSPTTEAQCNAVTGRFLPDGGSSGYFQINRIYRDELLTSVTACIRGIRATGTAACQATAECYNRPPFVGLADAGSACPSPRDR